MSIKQQKQESKLFQQLLEAKGTAFDIKDSTGDIMISYVYEELNELVEALIMLRRHEAINHPEWVFAMSVLINSKKSKYFRWHDSGDIQSIEHLKNIFEVCKATPNTIHWLPTREAQILKQVDEKDVPDNLVIRLSAIKVDGNAPKSWNLTSTVSTKKYTCMANKQGGKCLDCRACWDKKIKNIIYPLH